VVVTADPVRVSICHCFACQRRTGSSYGYQARFPVASITIIGHSKQFIRHSDEEDEIRRSSFCPECGTTVFFTGGESEDLIAIAVGAFAEPGFPPPEVSAWEERKHSWVVIPDEAEHIY
jgi:hypothetical protein